MLEVTYHFEVLTHAQYLTGIASTRDPVLPLM